MSPRYAKIKQESIVIICKKYNPIFQSENPFGTMTVGLGFNCFTFVGGPSPSNSTISYVSFMFYENISKYFRVKTFLVPWRGVGLQWVCFLSSGFFPPRRRPATRMGGVRDVELSPLSKVDNTHNCILISHITTYIIYILSLYWGEYLSKNLKPSIGQ